MKMSGCMCGHTQQKEEEASQQEYDVLDACAVGEEKMMPQQHCAGRKYRGISLKRSAKKLAMKVLFHFRNTIFVAE